MSHKIVDLIKSNGYTSYSFEVTPEMNIEILENLNFEPLFFSITWHAQKIYNSDILDLNDISLLKLAKYLRNNNKNVLIHISCTNLKKYCAEMLLPCLIDNDICNLFIILGENFDSNKSDFKNSRELIHFIRQRTGNYFCIGVAGFPDREDKILHLKEKVESGADFIITQAFFDTVIFKKFVNNCKEIGIHVPVLPGIFPFVTKMELDFFTKLCDVHLPKDLIVKPEGGIEILAKLIYTLKRENHNGHFHLFTLNNMQRSIELIKKVDSLFIGNF